MLMITKRSRPAGIRRCPGPSLRPGNQPELAHRRWLPGPATLGRVLGAESAAVGDRGEVANRGGALPGDEHRVPSRADRGRARTIVAVAGAVVALGPQLGAGGGVVGDRGVVVRRGG